MKNTPDALPRLLDELVWTLRRRGFAVAPTQVIDLLRAVRALGFRDPWAVREAVAALVVDRASQRPTFDRVFSDFFGRHAPTLDLWERLKREGFTHEELLVLRELLDALVATTDGPLFSGGPDHVSGTALSALVHGGAFVDQLLHAAGVQRELSRGHSPLQVGFLTHRAAELAGVGHAQAAMAPFRRQLREALGARGDALAAALQKELDLGKDVLRDRIRGTLTDRARDRLATSEGRALVDSPFTSLSDSELMDVRRAVRAFAERLRGAERVRARRARRGRFDVARTMRTLARTGGVPFKPVRKRRRRDKARLLLLCDISDSVRTASRFMLEFVHAAHDLFDRTRSFVFVSELGETTELFEQKPSGEALEAAYSVVPVTDNSNYGRVLRAFEARHLRTLDARTTVVILGDGRTNYLDATESVLDRIRARARALYWLCSEPRGAWALGDSAMTRYAGRCTRVFEVTTARELEHAARTLVWSR